ncbi:hypothetical protein [Nocardia sp. NPDC050717]|uniref:hypothetical protein n=1 Tax=Nocardia sp. NPDC050717 TaxID=3157221 RepID=UPI0033E082A4
MATHRVPVDQRWFGVDRRSIPYAAVALAIVALWAWLLPWIDNRTAWDDVTAAGEVLQVTSNVTMVVPQGWGLYSGLRADDVTRSGQVASAQDVLAKNGVAVLVQQSEFAGTTDELLGNIERIASAAADDDGFHVRGEPIAMSTAGELRGLAQGFSSARNVGVVVAFVTNGTGIEIQVVGPAEQMTEMSDEVYAMVDSLAVTGKDAA